MQAGRKDVEDISVSLREASRKLRGKVGWSVPQESGAPRSTLYPVFIIVTWVAVPGIRI